MGIINNYECGLIILIMMVTTETFAKDFGKQGSTFQVKEEGFVAMMQRKLKSINLAEHSLQMQDLAKKMVEEPTAIPGITKATKTISHSFDPSYVLDEDVFLPCGKLLYAIGTTVNPLDHMEWRGKMVFIDGRDKSQVAWVIENYITPLLANDDEELPKKLGNEGRDDTKIVLTGGKPLELERQINSPIYFDQFGELTKKFNITCVPAVVEQDGKYLKVTEIDIKRKEF